LSALQNFEHINSQNEEDAAVAPDMCWHSEV